MREGVKNGHDPYGQSKPVLVLRNDFNIDFNLLATLQHSQLHKHLICLDYKWTINFKDQSSLIALTSAILTHIFHIPYWRCPPRSLCPRIPNRLNYLLWLDHYLPPPPSPIPYDVVDIGTGSTLVYPLLAYSVFRWTSIAIDNDLQSYTNARSILQGNPHLRGLIQLHCTAREQKGERTREQEEQLIPFSLLQKISQNSRTVQSERQYLIRMTICNPPFHDTEQSPQRVSALTANEYETAGGEYAMFFRLYRSSFGLRHKGYVLDFSMLLGKQTTYEEVLRFMEGEQDYGVVEWWKVGRIQQGRNCRFIVAWRPKLQ